MKKKNLLCLRLHPLCLQRVVKICRMVEMTAAVLEQEVMLGFLWNVVTTTTSPRLCIILIRKNGTADESKVNTMMALFFDSHLTGSNNPALLTKLSWGTGEPEIGTPGQPDGTPTKAFKVDKNSKAFMIILNPSTEFTTNVASASTFDDVNKIIANTSVGAVIGGTNQNNFMMTNAKGKARTDNGYRYRWFG